MGMLFDDIDLPPQCCPSCFFKEEGDLQEGQQVEWYNSIHQIARLQLTFTAHVAQ